MLLPLQLIWPRVYSKLPYPMTNGRLSSNSRKEKSFFKHFCYRFPGKICFGGFLSKHGERQLSG